MANQREKRVKPSNKHHSQPFWQADKPYLHDYQITDGSFRALNYIMSFLAGAINAGGFFAVQSYISHITGSMSGAANGAEIGRASCRERV